jgi:hypothetical protein
MGGLPICFSGGLMFSQVLTLYITPVIFLYLERLGARFKRDTRLKPVTEAVGLG